MEKKVSEIFKAFDFDLENDFNKHKFREFLNNSKISPVIGKKEILENLSLLKQEYLKNAGVLLFCHKITKFFMSATITCVLYQGRTKYKILDRKEFNTDLNSNFQNAFFYLQSHLNTEFIIRGGPREEKLELPEDALREALLNAISHRDYFSNANILVEIFSNRVEITNPGGLVKGITKKDLGKKSLSRNNLLFGLLQRMGLVEKVGSGIKRMEQSMGSYKLGLKFNITSDWFNICFMRAKSITKRGVEKGVEITSEKGETIISLIKENPKISKEQIRQKGKLSKKSVEYNIQKLKDKGLLEHIGLDKGGYWKILKNGK
ncbi:MAG: hypothetical protein KKG60_03775 [Nanoarchaeota archaeon]|nr:hypothetical protein [Nanoarchaeota archaeon]